MRVGKVSLLAAYTVDLDNPAAVEKARQRLYDDIMSALKTGDLLEWIGVEEDYLRSPEDLESSSDGSLWGEEDGISELNFGLSDHDLEDNWDDGTDEDNNGEW